MGRRVKKRGGKEIQEVGGVLKGGEEAGRGGGESGEQREREKMRIGRMRVRIRVRERFVKIILTYAIFDMKSI